MYLCLTVDDEVYSKTTWDKIDSTASFSNDCATLNVLKMYASNVIVVPNPNRGIFTLQNCETVDAVRIYRVSGRLVESITPSISPKSLQIQL